MHNITQRAMVVGGTIQPRPMMYIALTYDHRLIDGREVRFPGGWGEAQGRARAMHVHQRLLLHLSQADVASITHSTTSHATHVR
jgi:hypothetical protein